MPLFEDTNPRTLKELLAEVHSRTSVLPNFQRDFVWEPSATQELIVSIANAYPAGSILRVRDKMHSFDCREFEGAPPLEGKPHTFLVLDGQQRLTSLYQAFYGVGEHRFYLDLQKLINGADFEDAIFHVRASMKWVKQHENFALQAAKLILPLSVLKGGSGGFLHWLLQATNPMPQEQRTAMLDALTKIDEQWIKTVDDYHFPVVTLSDTTQPDALCTIFETLNRTGVKLGVFELLTARFWPHKVNLRELWAAALEAHPIIKDFAVDPYYMLQAISLAGRPTPSCKRGDVLNLEVGTIQEWWPKVVTGLRIALETLRDDCHVVLPKWLTYHTMLAPMAAALAKAGLPNGPLAASQRDRLRQWFWCASFGQQYEGTPNTQSAKDVTGLVAWFGGGAAPETVQTFKFDPNTLKEVTPRQRALYRAVICLILAHGARDFYKHSVITGTMMETDGIDDHHVFPAHFLKVVKGIILPKQRDCVLNRTLIDRTTNQMISARAPSDYLAEMRSTPGFPLEVVLASHCLPSGHNSPLWSDQFQEFLDWRQAQLWAQIQKVTGVKNATDLESVEHTSA